MCAAAVLSCEVVGDRWILPHLAVRTWFVDDRWTAWVTQPRRFTPLWPASWVPSVDRSRSSKSAEVRRIWDIYDERLRWVDADDALAVGRAVASVMFLVFGLLGPLLLKGRWRMLSVWLVGLSLRGVSAWARVWRASIWFGWAGPKFLGFVLGALILGMVLWLISFGIIVWLRLLI